LIADCLELWWEENRVRLPHITELILHLDNGPHVQSRRRQFIKRLTEFADQSGLSLRLVYYPPYHSKYNPIERCWGILEKHWNGTLLNSVHTVVEWTKRMSWKGVHPVVHLLKKVYKKGVTLTDDEMERYEARLKRSNTLPKWDVTIQPVLG
jgi:transposase